MRYNKYEYFYRGLLRTPIMRCNRIVIQNVVKTYFNISTQPTGWKKKAKDRMTINACLKASGETELALSLTGWAEMMLPNFTMFPRNQSFKSLTLKSCRKLTITQLFVDVNQKPQQKVCHNSSNSVSFMLRNKKFLSNKPLFFIINYL